MKTKLTQYVLCAFLPNISKADACRHQTVDTTITKNAIPGEPTGIRPLLIGESIPAVVVPDAGGKSYDLNAKIIEKPTILVFYRGGWCPFCNKELAGLQAIQG